MSLFTNYISLSCRHKGILLQLRTQIESLFVPTLLCKLVICTQADREPRLGVPLVVPAILLYYGSRRCLRRGLLRLRLLLLFVQLLDRLDFLLQLHPSVLEPDLDLSLRQAQRMRHLYAPPPRQVVVRVEFLLELEGLVPGVGLPTSSSQAVSSCNKTTILFSVDQPKRYL